MIQNNNGNTKLERHYSNEFYYLLAAYEKQLHTKQDEQLEQLTDRFAGYDKDLLSIKITSLADFPLIDWQRPTQVSQEEVITFSDTIAVENSSPHKLEISWNVSDFHQQLIKQIVIQQLMLVCNLIILASLLMFLVNKKMIDPIKTLILKIVTLSQDSLIEINEIPNVSLEVSHLNKCVVNLGVSYKKLLMTEKVLNNAKQQIESLNRRNSNILNAAGEGIFVINKDGTIIFMNSAGIDMTGWEFKEISGLHFNRLMPRTHLNAKGIKNAANPIFSSSTAEKNISNTLKKAKKHHVNSEEFVKNNGEKFPVEFISTPLKGENHEIVGAVVTFKDINERLQAETKLKESQFLKQAMLESSHDAIITVDDQGEICEFNKEAEHMFGYLTDRALGKQLDKLIIPKRYREQHQDFFLEINDSNEYPTDKRGKIELYALRNNKQEFPVEIAVAPIILNNKRYFTAFISDVTERKQVKEAMESARQNAENANIAKSQFLATMSHEIRTPLSALVGVQDLLLTTELTEEQLNYIDISQQSAQTLQVVINDILDFSKIEAGKLILEFQKTAPMELVDSVLSVMASKAIEKNIELFYSIRYPIPKLVLLDPVRTKQVLYNLIGNAIKFTHQGYICVKVSMKQNDSGNDAIFFEVIDTGIGIPKESLPGLFDEFTQADVSTTRKYGGTGLGLAISSRLIKMSNGEINVSSVVGEGSNFSFTIAPVQPPLFNPKPIKNLNFWVLNSHRQGTLELFNQLKSLVSSVRLIDSLDLVRPYNNPAILIIDDQHLSTLSPANLAAVISRNGLKETFLTIDINQPKLSLEWKNLIDKQLSKPIAFKKLMMCLRPYTDDSTDAYPELSGVFPVPETLELDLNNRLILLAEDSELIQKVTANMLKKLNCRVDLADNGLIALQKVKEQHYDLILMDLSMPEMGGLETTEKIRSIAGINQNTPIVALTANAFKDDFRQCKIVGMNGFLTKPLTLGRLQSELLRILENQSNSESLPTQMTNIKETEADLQEPIVSTDSAEMQLINIDIIHRLQEETSKELFPQMIDLFIEQGQVRINAIVNSIQEHDFKRLASEIHTLKSESTTFGATHLGSLSIEANYLCKQGLEQQAFELATQLKPSWDKTKVAMQNILVT